MPKLKEYSCLKWFYQCKHKIKFLLFIIQYNNCLLRCAVLSLEWLSNTRSFQMNLLGRMFVCCCWMHCQEHEGSLLVSRETMGKLNVRWSQVFPSDRASAWCCQRKQLASIHVCQAWKFIICTPPFWSSFVPPIPESSLDSHLDLDQSCHHYPTQYSSSENSYL